MGVPVLNNQIFDSWLTKKSDEIISKVDREKISTEEMVILILKAQNQRFDHIDEEFKALRSVMKEFRNELKEIRNDFRSIFMWQTGILITLFAGLYLKIYF